jgi:hypothetical protein
MLYKTTVCLKKFRGILTTMNELNKLSRTLPEHTRLQWLYILTVLGVLCGIALSFPAWSSIRTYPLVPLLPELALPQFVHIGLLFVFVTSLLASLRYRSYQAHLLCLSISSLGLLCILDITRFQPWIFHYLAILSVFLGARYWRISSRNTLDAVRILIGGMYLWSGLQKLNLAFFTTEFPWFTRPLWELQTDLLLPPFLFFGLLAPFLEVAIGLGLFSVRTRTLALIGSFSMMGLVLVCLGPFGHDWNSVVWPWNIVLFLTTTLVFWKTDFTLKSFVTRQKRNLLGLSIFGLFWILPLGNVFGLVDHYLSWSLYSGRAPEATRIGDTMILSSLSPQANAKELSFMRWATSEMNVVPYPEERVFNTIFESMCSQFNQDTSLVLQVEKSQSYFNTDKIITNKSCGFFSK